MENNKFQESIDETVNEMKRKMEELTAEGLKIDEDFQYKSQYEDLRSQILDNFQKGIDNIEKMRENLEDNEKINKYVSDLKEKTTEVYNNFSNRVKEIEEEKNIRQRVGELAEDTEELISKVSENERVKSVIESLKGWMSPLSEEAVDEEGKEEEEQT